ncbi:glycosyltransferase family 2 protein [soil metagenome]
MVPAPAPSRSDSSALTTGASPSPTLDISLIAPAHNEAENIPALVRECGAALAATGLTFEFIIVDDGSTDATRAAIAALLPAHPWLRCVSMLHTPRGKGHGQSAAFHAGLRAARGRLIATIDADLQNDPADLTPMLALLREKSADVVQGDRSRARADGVVRKVGSWVGRTFRRRLLGDSVRDTGCSLRIMPRAAALRLPLEFRGMHRFIPVSLARMGCTVVEMPVRHRQRSAGVSKYGMGILQRALPGLIDLFAVRWMASRRRPVEAVELSAAHEPPPLVIEPAAANYARNNAPSFEGGIRA